jgi:biotin transport system substrate-specific component
MKREKSVQTKHSKFYSANTNKLRMIVFASLFAALTAIGVYITVPVPLSPVPINTTGFLCSTCWQ